MSYNLPKWLIEKLPELHEPVILSYADEKYIVTYNNENTQEYSNVVEAYDETVKKYGKNIFFDESLAKKEKLVHNLISVDANSNGDRRILLSYCDTSRLASLEEGYREFLEYAEKYKEKPEDFWNSYGFLVRHPAFWVKCEMCDCTFNWSVINSEIFRVAPYRDHEDGSKIVWRIYCGEHDSEFTEYVDNPALEIEADTAEDAFIKLAERVNTVFSLEGDKTPNPDYVPSDYEMTITNLLQKAFNTKDKD